LSFGQMMDTSTPRPPKTQTESTAVLIALDAPLKARRWRVDRPLLIGRAEERCDIVIPQRQVSRLHAQLLPVSEGVLLEDLGSKNGTFVNGERITQVLLQDGDIISIAYAVRFAFWRAESTVTVPLEESGTGAAPSDDAPRADAARRLRLDSATRQVWIGDTLLEPPLSAAQFRLLQILYEHPGQVVPREKLIEAIWGPQALAISSQALDALIHRLRERLAEADPGVAYLRTIRGQGLLLENPPR